MRRFFFLLLFWVLLSSVVLVNDGLAETAMSVELSDGNGIVRVMDDIYISEQESINGDLVAILGDIEVNGTVNGDVVAILGDVSVNNSIRGDLVSILGQVNQGENAEIKGTITQVSGFNKELLRSTNFTLPVDVFFSWGFKISRLIMLYGLTVLLFIIIPKHERRMMYALEESPGKKLGLGLLSVILFPLLILVFLLSLIGIPLIPFLILAFIVTRFIGYVAIVLWVGDRIEKVGSIGLNIFVKLLLGVIALWILEAIPVIGGIAYLVITFLALGVVLDTKFGTNKPWFNKQEITNEEDIDDEDE
ncbi:hypothetical protein [Fuchsiella alkaliacetigena]|uniref:hypothetical protein n=1 Tax=Fuchsiella alkaliacetigena TaxID=957042 RepID=UPI00200A8F28|nr:hypothetical protein [Fuchsiella alkaliacetigena]MCK8825298.1 hypothetical protein [Fuchsiella alkaliacetigena]